MKPEEARLSFAGICGIYCWTHLESGRRYIGSSVNIGRRIAEHIRSSKFARAATCFNRALRDNGIDSFDVTVLFECKPAEIFITEDRCIQKFNSASVHGFNTRSTAWDSLRNGTIVTELTRERQSVAAKNRSQSARRNMALAQQGKRHSVETRRKMSESHKGKIRTPEHCIALSKAKMGSELSVESRKKISAALTGRKISHENLIRRIGKRQSEETVAKRVAANKGKKRSPEFIEKLRARNRKPRLTLSQDGAFHGNAIPPLVSTQERF